MKIVKVMAIGIVLLLSGALQAQVSVSVNIGSPPLWGPAGYAEARYYYLPDVESYYDIHSTMFICYVGGTWVHRAHLPSIYRNYDLYNGYKVVMTDYYGNAPYMNFKEHKAKYAKGYHGPAQSSIGEKPGKGNSGAKMSNQGNKSDKGKGHGNGKKSGRGSGKSKKK